MPALTLLEGTLGPEHACVDIILNSMSPTLGRGGPARRVAGAARRGFAILGRTLPPRPPRGHGAQNRAAAVRRLQRYPEALETPAPRCGRWRPPPGPRPSGHRHAQRRPRAQLDRALHDPPRPGYGTFERALALLTNAKKASTRWPQTSSPPSARRTFRRDTRPGCCPCSSTRCCIARRRRVATVETGRPSCCGPGLCDGGDSHGVHRSSHAARAPCCGSGGRAPARRGGALARGAPGS